MGLVSKKARSKNKGRTYEQDSSLEEDKPLEEGKTLEEDKPFERSSDNQPTQSITNREKNGKNARRTKIMGDGLVFCGPRFVSLKERDLFR